MNDQEFVALKDWIAYDQSDAAQCVREAVAPTIQELAALINRARALALQPDRWVMAMRANVYSSLLPVRRRKLQPYIRQVWRRRDTNT